MRHIATILGLIGAFLVVFGLVLVVAYGPIGTFNKIMQYGYEEQHK